MQEKNKIQLVDCSAALTEMPGNSVDCCVTDPPYGYRFMGKKWDYAVPGVCVWSEVIRVLKPGGHLLCACGTRTQHRMAINIESAGFEIRDVVCWHYAEGLTKSMDIAKAIEKLKSPEDVCPAVPVAGAEQQWKGWGTHLKPATEFWTLARKPLSKKTIAANILQFGAGGLNIGACRTGIGRFPANVILDEYMAQEMDRQTGTLTSGNPSGNRKAANNVYARYAPGQPVTGYGDSGGGSRFFYVAKAAPSERGEGNSHPTVKPLALMRYLIKLVCPLEAGRIVFDPFAGSGSTCIAARQLGVDFIAFELVPAYVRIAEERMRQHLGLFY